MPGGRVATEWHLQQSPAMRDSLLTLPLLESLRDPTITPHQALRSPISFIHTHTHTQMHSIACWAMAQGVYVLPPWVKCSDRSRLCWYKQAWIRVLWWHARGTDGKLWSGQSRYIQTWQGISHCTCPTRAYIQNSHFLGSWCCCCWVKAASSFYFLSVFNFLTVSKGLRIFLTVFTVLITVYILLEWKALRSN